MLIISYFAIVGKSLLALPWSASPLLKKKLAPNNFASLKDSATVREIVDFPVLAILFNQKIYLSCGEKAHSLTW